MSYGYYPTSTDCSGTPLYFGYETVVKAIGHGTFCVTDNRGGIDMYSKWVVHCQKTELVLPSGVYEFLQSCTDVDCQNCSKIPKAAYQIPWSDFDDSFPRCMVARVVPAKTTDPAKEFSNMTIGTFASLLPPPTSASFGGESSSDEFNEYWQYYVDNSCIGSNLPATSNLPTTTSSSFTASENIMIQFGVFLSVQAYYMLMM